MKKNLYVIMIGIVVVIFLAGCSKTDTVSTKKTNKPTAKKELIQMYSQEDLQIFKDVIQNKVLINQRIFSDCFDKGTVHQPFYLNRLVENIGFGLDYDPHLSKFTILDMDGDKKPEMVINVALGKGEVSYYEVLHCYNNQIYGYYFVYRGMETLKAEGTFLSSGGACDNVIYRVSFLADELTQNRVAAFYMVSQNPEDGAPVVDYFIGNQQVSKKEFQLVFDSWEEKMDAKWYVFSLENVDKYFKIKK